MFSPNTFLFQVICFNFYGKLPHKDCAKLGAINFLISVVITVHSYRSAVTSTGVRVRRQFTDNG
jgi:hypothetical protein